MLAASLTEKALGSRVDVTSDNPVTKLGPSSVSSNSASDYRITIDSARKALKKGSVAFDGGVEIDKLRSNLKTSNKIQPYRTGDGDDSDDEDIVPEDFEGTTHMVGDSEEAEEGGVNIRSYYE